ncbi:MAG: translation initiation factor IF-2 [Planctomycetes bacterium]|nr:translation initiation factor IF-2 [Planctomycetota bacterium]
MTQKKRIYDLAKEYGMSGPDLAKHLRDRGFSQIKGHMTALDDFVVLQIQGLLEAEGHTPVQKREGADEGDASGGLILKKRKKKLSAAADVGDAPADEAPEAPEPEPAAPTPVAAVSAPSEPPAAPIEEPAPAPAPVHAEVSTPAPVEVVETPASAIVEAPEREPEAAAPLEAAAQAAPAPIAAVEAPVPAAAPAPAPAVAQAPAPATTPAPTPAAKPARKAGGKVVGFIDLSKIKTNPAPKKEESRRLRSSDDVTLNVQPTLGADKKRALLRGDRNARGTMTAGQLREAQSSRFLRRNATRGGPGGPGGHSGGGGGQRRGEAVSPYTGGKVTIGMPITVKKLADALSVKSNEVIKIAIQRLGMDLFKVTINSLLDEDTAVLLAQEFTVELVVSEETGAEKALVEGIKKQRADIDDEKLELRAPTVAFLGHVDHGKTTLIDSIRSSSVAADEAGGITQHIGAYQVQTRSGHALTIIDTPGHAAFTAMRARGANAVDIVVLVVAADDGVMPSTEEALAHARAAKVPLVVALTKMDKAEANPQKCMEQLARLEVNPEEWGGSTAFMKVSAVKKQGIDELLDRVFLESEVLELKCHPEGPAQGAVLEAEISEGKGIVAHLLVQDGTLRRGDVILAGEGYGKVRSMHDDRGRVVDSAPPSMPVEVSGLTALPGIGETFYVVQDLSQAKEVAEERARKNRAMSLAERSPVTAASLTQAVADSKRNTINLVVRADVQGSVEVLRSSLSELKHEEVEVKVVHAGVGAVTESDVLLAATTGATIIAFHCSVNDKARVTSDREGVEIRRYEIIYELLDDMRDLMEGLLAPEMVEEITGHVEVRAVFKSSKVGNIAGCNVRDGSVFRDSRIRVQRDGATIHEAPIGTLRREKDDAKEVREGFDCGITVRDFQDYQLGDIFEAYRVIKKKRTLGDKVGS